MRVLYLFVLASAWGRQQRSCSWCKPFPKVGTNGELLPADRRFGGHSARWGAVTMRPTADVAGKLTHVDNLSLATLTPQIVDALPGSAQSVIAVGYSDALLPLFLWFVPLMLACLVMMLLLKRHPLDHHQPRRRGKVGTLVAKNDSRTACESVS